MNMETVERMSSRDWAVSFPALPLCLQFVLLTSFSNLAKMLRVCFSITRKWWVNNFAKIRMHSKASLVRYQSAWDDRREGNETHELHHISSPTSVNSAPHENQTQLSPEEPTLVWLHRSLMLLMEVLTLSRHHMNWLVHLNVYVQLAICSFFYSLKCSDMCTVYFNKIHPYYFPPVAHSHSRTLQHVSHSSSHPLTVLIIHLIQSVLSTHSRVYGQQV